MLKPVLYNILEAGSGNKLVESRRGKTVDNIKVEDVIKKIQNDLNTKK